LNRARTASIRARNSFDGLAEAGAGTDAPDFAEAFDRYRPLTIDGWIAIVSTLAAGGRQPDDRMEVTAVRAINTLLDLDVERAIAAQLCGILTAQGWPNPGSAKTFRRNSCGISGADSEFAHRCSTIRRMGKPSSAT
jgi:hypothetical protein